MRLNRADQESLHRHSIRHRAAIQRSSVCGCFHCEARFAPTEITDWVDLPPDAPVDADEDEWGATALCPRCGIDAVLPDRMAEIDLDASILSQMRAYWF